MATQLPRTITVLIDSRERVPLLFPLNLEYHSGPRSRRRIIEVKTKVCTMLEGDYAIAGLERHCLIERKGSLRELHQNLMTRDRGRFLKAVQRMVDATRVPYLLLDMSPADMFRASKHVENPYRVFDCLTQVVAQYGLRMWYAGNCKHHMARRNLGSQVLRVILAHAYSRRPGGTVPLFTKPKGVLQNSPGPPPKQVPPVEVGLCP